jgi:hypothetical protein
METGENGFRHDPMAVRQVVIDLSLPETPSVVSARSTAV